MILQLKQSPHHRRSNSNFDLIQILNTRNQFSYRQPSQSFQSTQSRRRYIPLDVDFFFFKYNFLRKLFRTGWRGLLTTSMDKDYLWNE